MELPPPNLQETSQTHLRQTRLHVIEAVAFRCSSSRDVRLKAANQIIERRLFPSTIRKKPALNPKPDNVHTSIPTCTNPLSSRTLEMTN